MSRRSSTACTRSCSHARPDTFEKQTLHAFLDNQEKVTQAQLAQGKKIAAPEGYGVGPKVNTQVDRLFQALYGRPADRYERVALVEYLDRQQQKLAESSANDDVQRGQRCIRRRWPTRTRSSTEPALPHSSISFTRLRIPTSSSYRF